MSLNFSLLILTLTASMMLKTIAQTRPANQMIPQAGGASTLQRPQLGGNPQSQQAFSNNLPQTAATVTNINPGLDGVNSLLDADGTLRSNVQSTSREERQLEETVNQFRISSSNQFSNQQLSLQQSFYESLTPDQKTIFDNKVKYLTLTPAQRLKEREFMSSFVTPKVKVANQAGFDAVKRDLLPEAQRDFDPAEGMKNLALTTDQQRRFRDAVQRYLANPSARLEAESATMPPPNQRRFQSNGPSNLVPISTLIIAFLSCFIIIS
ncbi:secreted protein [Melampsora americana]|nr:secreted protein [Melampsora americana]